MTIYKETFINRNNKLELLLIIGFAGFVQGEIYWMTTAHPIFRFPVFLMGMLGGLQVLRAYRDRETSFHDPNLNKNLAHCILPWGWGSSCCKKKSVTKKGSSELTKESVAKIWKRRVDFNAFLYVGFLSALVVTKVTLDLVYGDKKSGIYMVYGPFLGLAM